MVPSLYCGRMIVHGFVYDSAPLEVWIGRPPAASGPFTPDTRQGIDIQTVRAANEESVAWG